MLEDQVSGLVYVPLEMSRFLGQHEEIPIKVARRKIEEDS